MVSSVTLLKIAHVIILMTSKIDNFDFDNILTDEKSSKNSLLYDISYKTLFGCKPLRVRFDEVYGFIIAYIGIRYFTLFDPKKYFTTYNKIWYLINQKSGITYVISDKYTKNKIDSCDSLPYKGSFC